jgi:hypothetical protein
MIIMLIGLERKSKMKIIRSRRLTVKFTDDQIARMTAAATSLELNLSELARQAINEKLDELGFTKESATQVPRRVNGFADKQRENRRNSAKWQAPDDDL